MKDLDHITNFENTCIIHSQWEGYLKDDRYQKVSHWVKQQGIQFHQVHTSGHASIEDLRRFAHAMAPKTLVPIHSAVPERFDELYPHVDRHEDGEWWEV